MFIDQVLAAVHLPPYYDRRLNQQCPFPLTLRFFSCSPLLCMGLKRKLVYKLMSSQHFWVKVLASSSSFLCELCAVCNSLCNNTLFNCICGIGYRSVFVWTLRVQGTEPVTCSHSPKDFICVFWVGSNGLGWLHRGYVFVLSILLCELWKAEM